MLNKVLTAINQSDSVIFYCENLPKWPIQFVSENISDYGYDAKNLMAEKQLLHEMVHENDWKILHQSAEDALKRQQSSFSVTVRFKLQGDESVWVVINFTFERDEEDDIVHLLGIMKNALDHDDEVMGLSHRPYLTKILKQEMARVNRYSQRFSLLLLNIDHFEDINEQYGRTKGDEVIQEILNRIKGVLRVSDYFGRWGGEEFMIIGLEMDMNSTLVLAEKIRQSVYEQPFQAVGQVTVSIGATVYYKNEQEEEVLRRLYEAVYLAKDHGRNRVEVI